MQDDITKLPVRRENVIITNLTKRGVKGSKENPERAITEIFLEDGRRIAEIDPKEAGFSERDMLEFALFFLNKQLYQYKYQHLNASEMIQMWVDHKSKLVETQSV